MNPMMPSRCPECGGPLNHSSDHPQVPLTDEYGLHAHVDEGIAELIAACWAAGIMTTSSCQEGRPGWATIGFAPGHAERFVGAATNEDLDDPATFEGLGWRMRGTESPESWVWQPGGFSWTVSFGADFPVADIPELVERLRRWE